MSTKELHSDFDQQIEISIQVNVEQFEEMLVSNQNLVRCDFRSDNTRGVYDPQSRTRYFIHEQELFFLQDHAPHFASQFTSN